MATNNATTGPTATSGPLSVEGTSAETSAAAHGLAEIFANLKRHAGYRRYRLECIDGELVFRQTEVNAALEAAIAKLPGCDRKASSGRRIIKLP